MINFSEEGLLIAISYLLPGYIINNAILKGRKLTNNSEKAHLFSYLIYSVINILFSEFINEIYFRLFNNYLFHSVYLSMILKNILLPSFIGIVLKELLVKSGKNIKLTNILELFGLGRNDYIETSWDYLMYELSEQGESYFILVLNDGNELYVKFGCRSYLSYGNSKTHDCYFEECYTDEEWNTKCGGGVYINYSEIKYILVPN